MINSPKLRPYWHVDAKWMTGFLLAFSLSATMLISGLVQITAEKPAVDLLTLAMALMYSPNGLDDEADVAIMRRQLQASPDKSIQPIPSLRITVREQDIAGLSPREARLFFFRKWGEPIYWKGIQGLADLADDPEMKTQIVAGGGLFGVLTLQTHQALQRALIVAAIVSLVLLVALVFFSFRFGRIGNPGCVFFVAGLPGAFLFTFIGLAAQPMATPPGEEAGLSGRIGYLLSNTLPPLAQIFSRNYLTLLALGLGLMLLAVLTRVGWGLMHRRRLAQDAD